MKILILDIYQHDSWRLVKDTAGGYGTGNDFGKGYISTFFNKFVSKMIAMPPMHAIYTFSVLKQKGIEAEYTREFIIEEIKNYDFIILVSSIICHETELNVLKKIHETSDTKVFVTGIFGNTMKKEYTFENSYVVPGEPEFFFNALEPKLEVYSDIFLNKDKQQEIVVSNDVTKLPYPDWEYYVKKYPLRNNFLGFNSKTAIPILATRGCPYSCFNYCTYPLQQGRKVRARDVDEIIDEMEHWKRKLKTNKFVFRDPVFSINRKFTEKLCKRIIERKTKVIFLIETHLKNLDDELLDLLYAAGLRLVYVGIESVSEKVLSGIKRFTIKNDEQYQIIQKCKDRKIIVKSMFMIGSPEDDESTINDTIKYASYLPNHLVQFSVFTPYPGTPMYKNFESRINSKKYEDFNQYNLGYNHDNLDQKTINKLKRKAYNSFYLNFSNFFVKTKSLLSIIF